MSGIPRRLNDGLSDTIRYAVEISILDRAGSSLDRKTIWMLVNLLLEPTRDGLIHLLFWK